ncbi:MAG: sulfite exporter TauE/SafE family protein [Alphaproteobacteria bacterium]|nr:sulfite exporter TauE/SafE family protein [Alphaproteobacteria bacterium]
MATTVLLCAAAFLAAMTQTATGFGFALLFAPLLTLALAPAIAVQVTILVTLAISLAVLHRVGHGVRAAMIARFAAGGLIGLPVGIHAIAHAARSDVQIVVGVLVLAFAAALSSAEYAGRHAAPVERSMPRWADLAVGAIAGAMTAGLAMPGPALIIYLLFVRVDKETMRKSLLVVFVFFYGAALALHAGVIGIDDEVWRPSALYATVAIGGAFAGDRIAHRLDAVLLRRIALGALVLIGLSTLAAGLGS